MSLKLVPKPEGFELNRIRADKTSDATRWHPEDAFYDAYLDMQKNPAVKALVVAWYESDGKGNIILRNRIAGESNNDITALGAEIFQLLTKP